MTSAKPTLGVRLRLGVLRALWAPLPRAWQLRSEMRDNGRGFRLAMVAARARKADRDELGAIQAEWSFEYDMLHEEYEGLYSRKLVNKAHRLRVPVPERPYGNDEYEDQNWRRGPTLGTWYLKPEGIRVVRAAVREERKAKLELLVPWLGLLIGLVGAVTGLMAVVLRR